MDLRALVREVPDFPVPGVSFKDITPVLADPLALRAVFDQLASPLLGDEPGIDVVVGIEARGFLLATPVADRLGAGFVPVRKAGKLPWATAGVDYGLEYGADRLEIHRDAIAPGSRVAIVDDVLATGGTAAAAVQLVEGLGGTVASFSFLIELAALGGRSALPAHVPVTSLLTYEA